MSVRVPPLSDQVQTKPKSSQLPGMRSVSILGATGSIGTSTIDLLVRNREQYRVEALTAQRNARGARKGCDRARRAICRDRGSERLSAN